MIVLDTNVISALMTAPRDPAVVDWLDAQPAMSVWTTAISVLEIRFGIERLAEGRRRDAVAGAFADILESELDGRVLGFTMAEAIETAALMARQRAGGRTSSNEDDMIAGIVRVHRATLATRNLEHFDQAGIALVNPWRS